MYRELLTIHNDNTVIYIGDLDMLKVVKPRRL
jgi:hypothetical protein